MRILANASRGAPNQETFSEKVRLAAQTGAESDLQKAKDSFDRIPMDQRHAICTRAVKQAETQKALDQIRRKNGTLKTPPTAASEALVGPSPTQETKQPEALESDSKLC